MAAVVSGAAIVSAWEPGVGLWWPGVLLAYAARLDTTAVQVRSLPISDCDSASRTVCLHAHDLSHVTRFMPCSVILCLVVTAESLKTKSNCVLLGPCPVELLIPRRRQPLYQACIM